MRIGLCVYGALAHRRFAVFDKKKERNALAWSTNTTESYQLWPSDAQGGPAPRCVVKA